MCKIEKHHPLVLCLKKCEMLGQVTVRLDITDFPLLEFKRFREGQSDLSHKQTRVYFKTAAERHIHPHLQSWVAYLH